MMQTLIIIPVSLVETGNALANGELANGGDAFIPNLSADGNEPPTHASCSVAASEENRLRIHALKTVYPEAIIEDYDITADPTYPQTRLLQLGLQQVVRGMYRTD